MPKMTNTRYRSNPPERSWQTQTPGWGGLNIQDLPYMLNDSQSPKMINQWIVNMTLSKRLGQTWDSAELPGNILSIYKMPYKGNLIFHAGTKLYKKAPGLSQPFAELMDGLTAAKGMFYKFNGKLIYKNGKDFIEYDGTTAKRVEPHIPVVFINRTPDGTGGDTNDDYNLFGSGFTNKFNSDGTAAEFVLTDKNLDGTPFKVKVGGVEITTGYTEDHVNGKVKFTAVQTKGQNNVEITAYKTVQEDIDKIIGCKYMIAYGGENNSRLFVAGNGTGTYYYSDALNCTYWPEQNYNIAGSNSSNITGFGEQYDILTVFNEEAVYGVRYSNINGKVSFPQVTINPNIGCDCPGSIELVNNQLVWLDSKRGPMIMESTAIEDERNIVPIGRNINGNFDRQGLLNEINIKDTISVDYLGKYWIAANGKVYMWDYANTPFRYTGNIEKDASRLAWFLFDNISSAGFAEVNNELYYARGNRIAKFYKDFYDFGTAIASCYRTPLLDFGIVNYLKNVLKAWVTTRADTNSIIKLLYVTEATPEGEIEEEVISAFSFNWKKTAWSTFTWQVINFAKTFRRKPKKKKIQRFAIEFSNNQPGADMNISEVKLVYTVSKEIKEN